MTQVSEATVAKLCVILHRCLVEARNLAQGQKHEQLYDLADACEEIPMELARLDADSLARIRSWLVAYQNKYPRVAYDHLAILDMDDAAFMQLFGPEASSRLNREATWG